MPGESEASVYTTGDLRKNLSDALGRAHFQGDVVYISHHGKPYAAVVSQDYARVIEVIKRAYGKKGWNDFKLISENLLREGPKHLEEFVLALIEEDGRNASRHKGRRRAAARG